MCIISTKPLRCISSKKKKRTINMIISEEVNNVPLRFVCPLLTL